MTSRSTKHRISQKDYNAYLADFFIKQEALGYVTTEVTDTYDRGENAGQENTTSCENFSNFNSKDLQCNDLISDDEVDIPPIILYDLDENSDDNCNENVNEYLLNFSNSTTEAELFLPDNIQTNLPDQFFENKEQTFSDDLFVFFMLFHLSTDAMQFLLTTLIKHGISVPKSVYLLKRNHQKSNYDSWVCGAGKVAYYSIRTCIDFLMNNGFLQALNILDIQVNIDGVPLYRSSPITLWPILIKISNCVYSKPLPVGFYLGRKKPDVTSFLRMFVNELKDFIANGFNYNGIKINVKSVIFICDAPARAMLQGIKSFSGYNGCGYCKEVGEYFHGRIIFPGVTSAPRQDATYVSMLENNQLSRSPLIDVVPLKSAFPPEYMHGICLGIMRKLLHYYCLPSKGIRLTCKFSSTQLDLLSHNLHLICKYLPVEFHRKLRSFTDIEFFKASEFRTLLLYIGPLLFKPFLQTEYYNNFCLIHFITYSLCCSNFKMFVDITRTLTKIFIKQVETLFGRQALIYNIHSLVHLPDFVEMYGCLDSFSAFTFENFLYQIKRRIKPTVHIFEYVANTVSRMPSLLGKEQSHSLMFSTVSPNNCGITDRWKGDLYQQDIF